MTQGYAAAIRANIAQYTGDLAGCVACGEQVLALLPETEVIARTTARLHVARSFRVTGDVTDAAERRVITAVAPIRASGSLFGTIGGLANLARLQGGYRAGCVRRRPPIASSSSSPAGMTSSAGSTAAWPIMWAWASCTASGTSWTLPQRI